MEISAIKSRISPGQCSAENLQCRKSGKCNFRDHFGDDFGDDLRNHCTSEMISEMTSEMISEIISDIALPSFRKMSNRAQRFLVITAVPGKRVHKIVEFKNHLSKSQPWIHYGCLCQACNIIRIFSA